MDEPSHPFQDSTSEDEFSFSVPLELDDEESLLSVDVQKNVSLEDQSIPRLVMADAEYSFNMQAKLSRPLIFGNYKGQPAFLLKPYFIFHGHVASWSTRIQSVQIVMEFADAPYSIDRNVASAPKVA